MILVYNRGINTWIEVIFVINLVKQELGKLNIDLVSSLSLGECEITRPHLLQRCGISSGSVIIFAVPYLTRDSLENRNISSYAVSKDYHLFFKSLFEDVISTLKKEYPENAFAGFSDHSPINEINAAAKAGLGVIGTNHLLITKKHSSYVFLGEIITDASLPSMASEIKHCMDCKKCISSCPVKTDIDLCLSSLTQKKGELNKEEARRIKESKCAWGCDICQEVCPYTESAIKNNTIFTSIEFFKNDLTTSLNSHEIEAMSDEQFSKRAYSWRGKSVISRNLRIIEGKES